MIMNNNDTAKEQHESARNNESRFFKIANSFLLLFVFLLSLALAIYAPRVIDGRNLGFDYMGVIVAVLAILVTTLIGWNIYNVISIKKEVGDFKRRHQHSILKLERRYNISEARFHKAIMAANGKIALLDSQTEQYIPYNWHEYLNSVLIALYYLYKEDMREDINASKSHFDSIWGSRHFKGVRVSKGTLTELIANLNKLKDLIEAELYSKFEKVINEDIMVE